MYDRVIRLYDPQNPSGVYTDEWLDAGLGALNLGNEILRMRRWLQDEPMTISVHAAVVRIIDGFGRFLPEPQRAVAIVDDELQHLAGLDPGPGVPERRGWARVLGSLEEMSAYLAQHPRLTKMETKK